MGMASAEPPAKRAPGQHGAAPLSERTRRRLLRQLLDRATAGDVAAAEALVRLGLHAERQPAAASA